MMKMGFWIWIKWININVTLLVENTNLLFGLGMWYLANLAICSFLYFKQRNIAKHLERALLTIVGSKNLAVCLYVTQMDRNMLLYESLLKPLLIFFGKNHFFLSYRSDMTTFSKSWLWTEYRQLYFIRHSMSHCLTIISL